MPRGRDHAFPGQRPRQGQGWQARDVPRAATATCTRSYAATIRLRAMAPLNQVRNCGVCHEDMMEGYLSSVHARSLFVSGLTDAAPSCSDCHGSHDIQRHDAAGARTSHEKSPETCGDCHKGILKEWDESAHGALWREGKDGPVCSTCHEAHAIQDPTTVAMRTHMPSDCGNCHEDLYKIFHDSFHGKATGGRPRRRQRCARTATRRTTTCRRATRARRSTRTTWPAPAARATATRAEVNASFLTFMPHSDPMDAEQNPWVHYIYLFMTAAAARRVRLLRPARTAVAAAHAGRPPARRVQGRALRARARTCAGSRPRRCGCTCRSS